MLFLSERGHVFGVGRDPSNHDHGPCTGLTAGASFSSSQCKPWEQWLRIWTYLDKFADVILNSASKLVGLRSVLTVLI